MLLQVFLACRACLLPLVKDFPLAPVRLDRIEDKAGIGEEKRRITDDEFCYIACIWESFGVFGLAGNYAMTCRCCETFEQRLLKLKPALMVRNQRLLNKSQFGLKVKRAQIFVHPATIYGGQQTVLQSISIIHDACKIIPLFVISLTLLAEGSD